jgi:hypothetical protein
MTGKQQQEDEAPRDPAQPELRQVRRSRELPPEEQNEHWALGDTVEPPGEQSWESDGGSVRPEPEGK